MKRNSASLRFLQSLVAADVSRRKYLKLARANVRGYGAEHNHGEQT